MDALMQLLPVLAPLFGAATGIRWIQEGERGVKLRFGKVVRHRWGAHRGQPKVLCPGFTFLIPGIDQLKKTHVRQRTVNCSTQKIVLTDRTVFDVSALVLFRVRDAEVDVYRVLFEIMELERDIANYCLQVVRNVLCTKDYGMPLVHTALQKNLLLLPKSNLRSGA